MPITFGAYLKKLREDRRMTLRDVEKIAEISNAYVSQLERNERGIPNYKVLEKLAKAYGVAVADLFRAAEQARATNLAEEEVASPDTKFISRGYEKLSPEHKKALKEFLQHLVEKDNKKKRR